MMLFRSIALLAAIYNCADAFVVSGNNRLQDVSLQAAAKKDALESLRKKEFVATMAEELGYTKTDAEAALTCALDIISEVSFFSGIGWRFRPFLNAVVCDLFCGDERRIRDRNCYDSETTDGVIDGESTSKLQTCIIYSPLWIPLFSSIHIPKMMLIPNRP